MPHIENDPVYTGLYKGMRVRVRRDVDAPTWATAGTVVDLPGPNSDFYAHPLVRWEADYKVRYVPATWLLRYDGGPLVPADADQQAHVELLENTLAAVKAANEAKQALIDEHDQASQR